MNGKFLTIIDCSVRHPCGLQLDDANRLFCASRVDHEVYCFDVDNKHETRTYERLLSEGSARFFGVNRDGTKRRGRGGGGSSRGARGGGARQG